jgi:oligoribonuclease NrnB/cAMP/cGMP phosphodiesterase (DHH superfamily)
MVPFQRPDLCIYHHPCADGFTSAWAVWTRWPDIEFHPGSYDSTGLPDVRGKHVLIVDFSYRADVLRRLRAEAASITILDHHKSAAEDLLPVFDEGGINGEFDMERSGAMMTWQYVWGDGASNDFNRHYQPDYVPWLVKYVQDRDLWQWKLPKSREVCAYAQLTAMDFKSWDKLAQDLEDQDGYNTAVEIGTALVKRAENEVGAAIRATKRWMWIGGYYVPVANVSHFMASDAGNILSKGQPFAATYFDGPDGRCFSLRSDKHDSKAVDVSKVAFALGGGGHANASGFTMPECWEGDAP